MLTLSQGSGQDSRILNDLKKCPAMEYRNSFNALKIIIVNNVSHIAQLGVHQLGHGMVHTGGCLIQQLGFLMLSSTKFIPSFGCGPLS